MHVPEKKIIVCCSQAVTGGPELLHQLVHELRSHGRDATISYYPFDRPFSCPEPYKKYDAPQSQLFDDEDTFIVIPETATFLINKIKNARIGIWWLSVDNYLLAKHQSKFKDIYLRYKSLIRHRQPMRNMRHLLHFTQSAYAGSFLEKAGIKTFPLSDYLARSHLVNIYQGGFKDKENIIVYNPMKGQRQTQALMKENPNLEFRPIQNMTPIQVAELLHKAKIYIDFGHHPGKDRPPREAAIAGCCVITGRKGSAMFYEDIPIPDKYKLDDTNNSYIEKFPTLVSNIFEDFANCSNEFESYRQKILKEPELFKMQVGEIFG